MRLLTLDVSTTFTGYAVFEQNGDLAHSGQFCIKDRTLTDIGYTCVITKEVVKLIKKYKITELVIEDIFISRNPDNFRRWARVHGGLGLVWSLKYGKEPTFYMAIKVRPTVGIKGNAKKIEIQMEVCKRLKLVSQTMLSRYMDEFLKLVEQKKKKQITSNQLKYRVDKLSKAFEEESKGISEHIADAIVLGFGYFKDKRGEQVWEN